MIYQQLVQPCLYMSPQDIIGATEIIEKRRQNGKTYDLKNGQLRTSLKLGAIHYKDLYTNDEQWNEINLTIDAQNQITQAPYNLEIFTDRIGYQYESKRNGTVLVELDSIDGNTVSSGFSVRREGNQIFWDGVDTDIDLKILARPLYVEIFKQIKTSGAKRQFRWHIKETKNMPRFRRSTLGQDANKDRLEILTDVTIIPNVKDDEFYYDELWTGRVSRIIDIATRQKAWFNDPLYPAIIDATTSENIVANNDDGYERNSTSPWLASTTFAGGNYWVGGWYAAASTYLNGGVRFQTLGVPQGSTINSATITVNVPQRNVGGGLNPTFIIYGDDVDSAAAWANNSRPSQITQTAANTAWTNTATGTFTINITGIVQEIITRPGWASGNIRFGFINQQAATGFNNLAYFYDYNQGQPNAAQLDVDYTPPSTRIPRDGVTNFQIPGIV